MGSLLSVIFIEEDLRRYQKDVEATEEKLDSIRNKNYKENEEYLVTTKKSSNKSPASLSS